MIPYKKENVIFKMPLQNVKVGGYAGELMDVFFEKRIFSDWGKNVVFKEAEEAFVKCTDDSTSVGMWQGEFWGKWVISAARAFKYNGNEELKDFLHNAALNLIKLQRKNGYIGTYKNSENFMSPPPSGKIVEEMGWDCDWNWNIWCRKYTLWGLLECYDITGDEKILKACRRLADNLITELEKNNKRLGETGTFKGLPSCSILKPMLILYRITENEEYLSFCLDFVKDWENPDIMPGLIANSLAGKPLSDWYSFDKRWAKAYEMMSCFDGIAELYRVTGTEKYLKACEKFYDILLKYEINPLYSVGFNDEFRSAAFNVNAITEPCDVIHWMRLCHELFLLTGDSKYMDSFELAFFNPFLASSYKDGMWGARGARGQGRHLFVLGQAGMKHNHCCVNNMPRGYLNMAESCITTDDESIYINLYNDAEVTTDRGVNVVVSGDYFVSSSTKITVDFGDNPICKIKLRIPGWSRKTVVLSGGNEYMPEIGYFTVNPTSRVTEIEICFDDDVRIIPVDAHNELPEDEWKLRRWVSANTPGECPKELFLHRGRCILQKGPLLLCRSKLIGNTHEEMFGGGNLIDSSCKCVSCESVTPSDGINVQFNISLQNSSGTTMLKVCDYASGTNTMTEDEYFFSIYF